MKCLLCDFKSNETDEVKNHYLNFPNVDRNMCFLKEFLKTRTMFFTEEDA